MKISKTILHLPIFSEQVSPSNPSLQLQRNLSCNKLLKHSPSFSHGSLSHISTKKFKNCKNKSFRKVFMICRERGNVIFLIAGLIILHNSFKIFSFRCAWPPEYKFHHLLFLVQDKSANCVIVQKPVLGARN